MERSGRPEQIRCPFLAHHMNGDQNPSARIFPESNKIHCFTASCSYDIVDAVQERFELSFIKAIEFIEKKKGFTNETQSEVKSKLQKLVGDLNKRTSDRKRQRKTKNLGVVEKNLVLIFDKLKVTLTPDNFQKLSPIRVELWEEYEREEVEKFSVGDQVRWIEYAKGRIRRELKLIKEVCRFKF